GARRTRRAPAVGDRQVACEARPRNHLGFPQAVVTTPFAQQTSKRDRSMPHANMGNWRSKITGEPVDANYQAPRSVAELVSRRAKGSQIFEKLNVDLPELGEVHHGVLMRGQPNSTPVAEIYVPKGTGPFPVLLHIHGGGWFAGSAAGERKFGMTIATAGFVVVNIDYALAPEHPF